jgi:tRNA-Thr(GGU) m(6)t(6)A37 methyltransferase TsaA
MNQHKGSFEIRSIGQVRCADGAFTVEILPPYRPALAQLDQFGHAFIIWWADRHDNDEDRTITQCRPPYAGGTITGLFACRSEYRPNPVAITVCPLLSVDVENGVVQVPWIDAEDGTPVIDLKAYFPICDRVRDVRVPEWVADWPEWVEDAYLLADPT